MIGRSLVRGLVPLTIAASLFAIALPTSADQITDHITQAQRQLNRVKAEIAALKAQIAEDAAKARAMLAGLPASS